MVSKFFKQKINIKNFKVKKELFWSFFSERLLYDKKLKIAIWDNYPF